MKKLEVIVLQKMQVVRYAILEIKSITLLNAIVYFALDVV
jgi:hypothetical protein